MSRQFHEYNRNMRNYLIGRYVGWSHIALRIDQILTGNFYQDHRRLLLWRQHQFGVQPFPFDLMLGSLENARANRQAPALQPSHANSENQMMPSITYNNSDQWNPFPGHLVEYPQPPTPRYRYMTPDVRRADSSERLRLLEADARLRRERWGTSVQVLINNTLCAEKGDIGRQNVVSVGLWVS
jgi:hypothetical protein